MGPVLLLLPSATYRAGDFLAAARRLGLDVVVASDRRQLLPGPGGRRTLVLRLDDPERAAATILDLAARQPLAGLVAVDDQGVLAAALAAERLGLRHNSPSAVARTRDKAALRAALAAAGVPQPAFRVVSPADDLEVAATSLPRPWVIKPVGLAGSRGVIRADGVPALRAAAARAGAINAAAGRPANEPLLLEAFIPGPEVAVEGLLRAGRLEVLALFDKPDPLDGPFFEETIYVTPSRLPRGTRRAVHGVTAQAAAALGLTEGPVHAELRLGAGDPDGIRLLEIAARSIGGLCARTLRFGAGIGLDEVILRHAVGLPLDGLRREPAASGVMMLPISRAGRLVAVRGQQAARQVPGIVGLEITIARGRFVVPLPEGDRYLGFLFARAPSPELVESALREAHACLDMVVRPL